jgi:hypothetical protein
MWKVERIYYVRSGNRRRWIGRDRNGVLIAMDAWRGNFEERREDNYHRAREFDYR